MNCETCQISLERELAGATGRLAEVQEHLHKCPQCQDYAACAKDLDLILKATPPAPRDENYWRDLNQRTRWVIRGPQRKLILVVLATLASVAYSLYEPWGWLVSAHLLLITLPDAATSWKKRRAHTQELATGSEDLLEFCRRELTKQRISATVSGVVEFLIGLFVAVLAIWSKTPEITLGFAGTFILLALYNIVIVRLRTRHLERELAR